MNNHYKVIPSLLLILGIFGVILGQMYGVINIAGNPTLVVSAVLLAISLLLFFVNEKVVFAWSKFAGWWVTLSIVAVWMFPFGRGGFLPPGTDKGILSLALWSLFFFISLILIAYKSYSLRGK